MNQDEHRSAGTESERVAEARSLAAQRHHDRRSRLRPLGLVLLAVVVVSTLNAHPAPGASGTRLGVAVALAVYAALLVLELQPDWPAQSPVLTAVSTSLLGGAGIALAALQPHAAAELAASVAVWLAATRLRRPLSLAVAGAVTAGLTVAIALTAGDWHESAAATLLLCVLLFFTGELMRRAHEGEERTELLLAELEDARDAQAAAAAGAERSRIARDLHDVLAHTLSALTIRLEGARLLAERERVSADLAHALAAAGELARGGAAEARQAVGALRGEPAPSAADLPALVASFRELGLDVTLEISGASRALPAGTSPTIYRAAQEALTNTLRYAPASTAQVKLVYEPDRVLLAVEDTGGGGPSALAGLGGGRGLTGMRERVEALGGRMKAGPDGPGFRVEVEAPA